MLSKRLPWAQMARFICVGGGVVAVDTGIFLLLYAQAVPAALANAAGMLAGFVLGLFAHHRITFQQNQPLGWATAVKYTASFGINLLLGTLSLKLALALASPPLLAKLLSIGVVTISNFLLSRYFVFSSAPISKDQPQP